MTLEAWFWIIYVLSFLFGGYTLRGSPEPYPRWGNHVLFYILIGLLGLQVFHSPIK